MILLRHIHERLGDPAFFKYLSLIQRLDLHRKTHCDKSWATVGSSCVGFTESGGLVLMERRGLGGGRLLPHSRSRALVALAVATRQGDELC
jgi:hypothetical protein